ncbi:hypothetical protein [Caldimonas tepidiphila]|uniref:hypothetical protein n=1 Tax=Caldimonas tepidiphila TaxID=2315841 RepID=UPI0013002506|nr:hypothetical protein [Caldimonas tepidiphila]
MPSPADRELLPATLRWLAALPPHVRPIVTGQKHPHVLNRLCDAWLWPMRVRNQFLDLLIDQRGNRRGFSFEVLDEISTLQNYYVTQLTREQRAFWDEHRTLM